MELKNICKSFNGKTVLHDISLSVNAGERVMLRGVSGRGKTTLLRIMMGVEKPDSGEVVSRPEKQAAVFQEDRLPEAFSVYACVKACAPKDLSREDIIMHLSEVGLGGEESKSANMLSGGMRRRTAIVRAVINDADVLYLDEPFTGLDDATKKSVVEYINRHTEGKTIVLVSHDAADAELMGARIIQL